MLHSFKERAGGVFRLARLKHGDLRYFAAFLSCLLSLLDINANPLLNDDAFKYLRAAETFLEQGLGAVLDNYGWYGYSILFALLHSLLPVSLVTAAHLLNTLLYCLLVYVFITLAMEFKPSPRVKIFAAVIILCLPALNEMRHNLARDVAFWTFSLAALLQLIRFCRRQHLANGAAWLLASLAAIFFRLEGLLPLALAPFALLAIKTRRRGFFVLLSLAAAALLLVYGLARLAGVNLVEVISYSYRFYLPLLWDYPATLGQAAAELNQALFASHNWPEGFFNHSMAILLLSYLYLLAANLYLVLEAPLTLLLLYGFALARVPLAADRKWPLLLYLGGALLSLFLFASIMHFLTQRYAVPAALFLLIPALLYLDALCERAKAHGWSRKLNYGAAFCLVYYLGGSLVNFGHSTAYREEAIDWLRASLGGDERLLTNNYAIAYFSGLVEEYEQIETDPAFYLDDAPNNAYLALDLRHYEAAAKEAFEQERELELLATFANDRADEIRIYRVGTAP